MARIIPDSVFSDPKITLGERKLVRGLYNNLEDSCIVWYQPKIQNSRRPDVIVYIPEIGIILYEVKDWSMDNIINANPDIWKIKHNDSSSEHISPFKQARNYYYDLIKDLKKIPELQSSSMEGKIKIPIATAVSFPNIKESEFKNKGYDRIIESKYILFQEDMKDIGTELIGQKLLMRLKNHFDPWWQNDELNNEELDLLRGTLYPEITSIQKDKGGKAKTIILDEYQEQVAKKIGEGHRIIRGVAGSGKSLVLCSKIRLLLQEHPDWKILLTCYNVSLASQLKYYLKTFADVSEEFAKTSTQQIKDRVDVLNYHLVCNRIFTQTQTNWPAQINENQLRQTARFQNMEEFEIQAEIDEMQSALLGQKLQEVLITKTVDLYDAILVDESQDFHTSWLKSLTMLLGKSNFLLLAEDPNQKIYPRKFTYSEAGIDVVGGGKIFNLPITYRSTKEIVLTASKLVNKSKWDEFYKKFISDTEDQGNKENILKRGSYPEIIIKENYEDLCDFIAHDIKSKISEYKYQDIGILYLQRNNKERNDNRLFKDNDSIDYVTSIKAKLAMNGIPNYWLSENRGTKKSYEQFRDSVTISTVFSAKGLEFEVVYLVGIELFPWPQRNTRENASMLYVEMTRAKERVYLLSTKYTTTIKQIEEIISDLKKENV